MMHNQKQSFDIDSGSFKELLNSRLFDILKGLYVKSITNGSRTSLIVSLIQNLPFDGKDYKVDINISIEQVGFEMDKLLAMDEFKAMLDKIALFMTKYKISDDELEAAIVELRKDQPTRSSMDEYKQEKGND